MTSVHGAINLPGFADGLRCTIDYLDDLLSGRLPPDVVRLAPPRRERTEVAADVTPVRRAAGITEDEAPFRRRGAQDLENGA